MESLESVYKTVNEFIKNKFSYNSDSEFECSYNKMESLSNDIYQVIIKDKKTNKIILEIAYRNFGVIGELVNRKLEEGVITALADFGIGPKIYKTDHKNYRIEEFVTNSFPIPFENLKNLNTIQKMNKVLVSYSEICPIYKYELINGEIKLKKFDEKINFPVETFRFMYEKYV